MKKIYIQPQTEVVLMHLTERLLAASENPDVIIGEGKEDDFDTKDQGDWNIWE